jgi:cation diffusion facilitator family transporter
MASGSKKVIYAALVGNLAIAITKFAAATLTGSSAMFSESVHSLVDTGNQGLLLYGIRRSTRPPDAAFPFGHGKEIYFWSFAVAILIFAVGAGVSLYEGIHGLLHPNPIGDPTINYVVLGLAMAFEGVAWYMALRQFSKEKGRFGYFEAVKRGKDPTLFVVLFEDSAAMLGLVVAFLGVFLGQVTGWLWLDGAAAVIIGLLLAGTAVWLAIETKSLLIGESAPAEVVDGIRAIAAERPRVERVNEVLTMHMGPDFVLVNLSVEFRDAESTESIERTIALIDAAIKNNWPEVKRVFIEAETRGSEDKTSKRMNPGNESPDCG